jgi:hypothetical protein
MPESKIALRVEESVGSGGLGERLEGDLVAEAFELVDQAAFLAFGVLGVASVEELSAELVVGDALVQDVVGGGEDLVGGRALEIRRRDSLSECRAC